MFVFALTVSEFHRINWEARNNILVGQVATSEVCTGVSMAKHFKFLLKITLANFIIWCVFNSKQQCKNITKLSVTKKIVKERRISYWNNEEISGRKTHTNTWKLNWSVLIIIDVFLDREIKLPCVYVCLLSRDLFIFLVRDSSFFSYVLSYPYFSTFLSM